MKYYAILFSVMILMNGCGSGSSSKETDDIRMKVYTPPAPSVKGLPQPPQPPHIEGI
jgi:uncharacterized protein YceK